MQTVTAPVYGRELVAAAFDDCESDLEVQATERVDLSPALDPDWPAVVGPPAMPRALLTGITEVLPWEASTGAQPGLERG